jgi:hypothetical protein
MRGTVLHGPRDVRFEESRRSASRGMRIETLVRP